MKKMVRQLISVLAVLIVGAATPAAHAVNAVPQSVVFHVEVEQAGVRKFIDSWAVLLAPEDLYRNTGIEYVDQDGVKHRNELSIRVERIEGDLVTAWVRVEQERIGIATVRVNRSETTARLKSSLEAPLSVPEQSSSLMGQTYRVQEKAQLQSDVATSIFIVSKPKEIEGFDTIRIRATVVPAAAAALYQPREGEHHVDSKQ